MPIRKTGNPRQSNNLIGDGIIMAYQEELSPLMKQRLAGIGELTPEEKDRIGELEKLDSLLKDFYKGEVDVLQLWKKLKDYEEQDKQFLLREACEKLKKSFKWKRLPIKFLESDSGRLSLEFNEDQEEEEDLVVELNDASFDQVIKQHPLVVVDCWAEWCAPCKMVAPVIEELASDYKGRITFGKLNVDFNQLVAARFGVRSIPTLLIFKNGQLVGQKVGALPKQMLESELKKHL
jgi:thioredoxin 1